MESKLQAPNPSNGSVRDSYTESTYVAFVMPPNLDLNTPEMVAEVLTICTETLKAARRILSNGNVSDKQFWLNQIELLEAYEKTIEKYLSSVVCEGEII